MYKLESHTISHFDSQIVYISFTVFENNLSTSSALNAPRSVRKLESL